MDDVTAQLAMTGLSLVQLAAKPFHNGLTSSVVNLDRQRVFYPYITRFFPHQYVKIARTFLTE